MAADGHPSPENYHELIPDVPDGPGPYNKRSSCTTYPLIYPGFPIVLKLARPGPLMPVVILVGGTSLNSNRASSESENIETALLLADVSYFPL